MGIGLCIDIFSLNIDKLMRIKLWPNTHQNIASFVKINIMILFARVTYSRKINKDITTSLKKIRIRLIRRAI
jgi:hypothetical protein